ncbi:hypothetical protein Tco_1417830, partial [Tanacetum coccineum]
MDMKLLSASESNNTLARCCGWPLVLAILGQMAHLVASITLNSTRSGSIRFDSFLPSVLLWLVIIVVVVGVGVTVFVVVAVIVIVESSSVIKLSFMITIVDQLREDIPIELSIVETDKVNHTMETDMMKLVVEIKCFGVNFDEFDKETGSSDELQPKQA